MDPTDRLRDGKDLSLRAEGQFNGYSWEFRGDIVGDSAYEWSQLTGPHGGGCGGSAGALPLADVGYKVLGHIGSFGWSARGWSRIGFMRRAYHPGTINGVVSAEVGAVHVTFRGGEKMEARLMSSGRDDVKFFFLIHSAKRHWAQIVALAEDGHELDRVDRTDYPDKP